MGEAAYEIRFRRSALRELGDLRQPLGRRVTRAIQALAHDPRPPGVTLLSGPERIWRIRVGDYRVVYRLDDDRRVVTVLRVRHRKDAYR
jgi:mRNA interferase RelE/StbE